MKQFRKVVNVSDAERRSVRNLARQRQQPMAGQIQNVSENPHPRPKLIVDARSLKLKRGDARERYVRPFFGFSFIFDPADFGNKKPTETVPGR